MEMTEKEWDDLGIAEDKEISQFEYDSLVYEPVYTKIKMNDEDSGRYPQ